MFELQKRFSFFDNVSDTVQELGVFELQMNAACFDKDTCTVIEVRRIHTSKRFSLYSYRSLARSNSQEIQFVSTETVIGVWCARAQKGIHIFMSLACSISKEIQFVSTEIQLQRLGVSELR